MKKLLTIICLVCCFSVYSQHTIHIKHKYYESDIDTCLNSTIISFYVQTKEHAAISNSKAALDRKVFGAFRQDPLVPLKIQKKITNAEYSKWNSKNKKLGKQLDKGHLTPYSAMDFDTTAALESMYIENTDPQAYLFNEHQWERVEMEVLKKISPTYGDVKVWTGVLVDTSCLKMEDLYVPAYYWKVIQYTKDGKIVTKSWLGQNTWSNTNTNPDAIIVDLTTLKTEIHRYYPDFKLQF